METGPGAAGNRLVSPSRFPAILWQCLSGIFSCSQVWVIHPNPAGKVEGEWGVSLVLQLHRAPRVVPGLLWVVLGGWRLASKSQVRLNLLSRCIFHQTCTFPWESPQWALKQSHDKGYLPRQKLLRSILCAGGMRGPQTLDKDDSACRWSLWFWLHWKSQRRRGLAMTVRASGVDPSLWFSWIWSTMAALCQALCLVWAMQHWTLPFGAGCKQPPPCQRCGGGRGTEGGSCPFLGHTQR